MTVGVTRSTYGEIEEKMDEAVERGRGLKLHDGCKVVIKINLCDFRMPESGAVTHPIFLRAVLKYLRSHFTELEICVVESDATVARPDRLVTWLGLEPILQEYQARWLNLSKDKTVKKMIDGYFFREMEVPKVIEDSDCLITMPKMKTSLLTKITCSLKNQYGCIPYPRKIRFHHVLDDAIADACLAMKPDFCIVDGILGMGGVKGPDLGVPIQSNVVVTGSDAVAVDSVCAEIMNFQPNLIGHIRKAQAAGVGRISREIVGEKVSAVRKDFEYNLLYASALRLAMRLKLSHDRRSGSGC